MAKKALKKTAKKKSAKPVAKPAVKKAAKKTAKKASKKAAKKPKPSTPGPVATAAATGGDESPDPHRMLPLIASLDTLRGELAPIDPDNADIQAIIDAIDGLKAVLRCQGGQTFPTP